MKTDKAGLFLDVLSSILLQEHNLVVWLRIFLPSEIFRSVSLEKLYKFVLFHQCQWIDSFIKAQPKKLDKHSFAVYAQYAANLEELRGALDSF